MNNVLLVLLLIIGHITEQFLQQATADYMVSMQRGKHPALSHGLDAILMDDYLPIIAGMLG
ncbi:MAG: hypothetical protein CL607_18185 [Anaerolineaceae bacterium]|nr:hypothetical protein [Anaerolineaceae bacterium]